MISGKATYVMECLRTDAEIDARLADMVEGCRGECTAKGADLLQFRCLGGFPGQCPSLACTSKAEWPNRSTPPYRPIGYRYIYRTYVFQVSQGIALYPPKISPIAAEGRGPSGGYRAILGYR